MRWATIGPVLLMTCAAAGSQEITTGWVKYSAADAGVAVLFPGRPKISDTQGGKEVLFEMKGGKGAFMLRLDPFPAATDPGDPATADRVFETVTTQLKKNGWAVKKQRRYKIQGKYPAADLAAASDSVPEHRIQIVLTPKWVVQVHAGGPKGTVSTEDARLFVNSLTLKE